MAWVTRDQEMHCLKGAGSFADHLDELRNLDDCVAMVGHCRYATHGSPQDNRNNHPHPCGTFGSYVHNGVVRNHQSLIAEHDLTPRSECDSEVLGLLMARDNAHLLTRVTNAVEQTTGDLAMLCLWKRPARIVYVRRGNPLKFSIDKSGWWFASQEQGLPGKVFCMKQNHIGILSLRDKQLWQVDSDLAHSAVATQRDLWDAFGKERGWSESTIQRCRQRTQKSM